MSYKAADLRKRASALSFDVSGYNLRSNADKELLYNRLLELESATADNADLIQTCADAIEAGANVDDVVDTLLNSEHEDPKAGEWYNAQADLDEYISEQAEAIAPTVSEPEVDNNLTNDDLISLRIAATCYFNCEITLAEFDSRFKRYFGRSITEAEWEKLQTIARASSVRINGELKVDGCAASEPMKALFKTMSIATVSEVSNVIPFVSGFSPRRTQQQLANRTVRRRANRFYRELALAA